MCRIQRKAATEKKKKMEEVQVETSTRLLTNWAPAHSQVRTRPLRSSSVKTRFSLQAKARLPE